MKKQNWSSVLVALVAAFIGAGTGACVALWFKLPDHTVDVFAFVESALGIRLTGLALIVTLGVIRQSAAMETMPATKRDEMVAEVRSRLENETLQSFRNQYTQEFSSLRGRVDTLQSSLETVHGFLQQEDKRINQLEKQDGRWRLEESEEALSTNSPDDEIAWALAGIRNRLDTLTSINAENILIPGGPQERYHQIVEEAYAALGLLETQVDELRAELEYQHKRLNEARDAALAEATQEKE